MKTKFQSRGETMKNDGMADVRWLAEDSGYSCTFDICGGSYMIRLTKENVDYHHQATCFGDTLEEVVMNVKEFFKKE